MASKLGMVWTVVKVLLIVWGVLSLVCGLGALMVFGYSMTIGNKTVVDKASLTEGRQILNWCGLDPQNIESIAHSYISQRSFTGDHLDVIEIKLNYISQKDLDSGKFEDTAGWYRGDRMPKDAQNVVALLGDWVTGNKLSWFPQTKELKAKDIYVYPLMIHLYNMKPTATDIMFLRPQDKTLFYVSFKM